jgi:toxin ParE1/3/4
MKRYKLSKRADNDVLEIANYSIRQFGPAQSKLYERELENLLNLIIDMPYMGKAWSAGPKGVHRFEYKSHTIFYKIRTPGIFVLRILHQRMDSERHL